MKFKIGDKLKTTDECNYCWHRDETPYLELEVIDYNYKDDVYYCKVLNFDKVKNSLVDDVLHFLEEELEVLK